MKKVLILSFSVLLASCSMFSSEESSVITDGVSARPTLAELDLQPIKVEPSIAPSLSLKETRDEYAALLPLLKDEKQKQQVAFRLADIEMQLAERAQEEGIPLEEEQAQLASTDTSIEDAGIGQLQPASYFNKAISRYREVLEQQADLVAKVNLMKAAAAVEGADPIDEEALAEAKRTETKYMDAMYQLSRALDLDGKKEESVEIAKRFLATFPTETNPVTNYHIELYFRIGEYYFTRTDYDTAVFNYGQVLALSEQASSLTANNFYGISAYMQGWSFFKQEDHPNALVSFSKMLDETLDDNSYTQTFTRVEELPLGQQRLVKDTLRIMALLFSYSGNGEAIKDFFAVNGQRAYEHLIYEELAQQHLNNDRFKDSADTLLVFASTYPVHGRAVEFYVRHIDAYILGDFPTLVLEAKQGFVATYGVDGPHFDGLNSLVGRQTSDYLRQYLKELAQSEHSIAQTLERMLGSGQSASASNGETAASSFVGTQLSENQSASWSSASVNDLNKLKQEAFEAAAIYYDQFIRTFSPDEEVAQMRFYLAEALSSAGKLNKAIESFEIYAYQDSPNPLASEAAYAALILFERVTENSVGKDAPFLAQLEARKMISQQLFVENFAADPRTVNVTQSLMQRLFEQEKYIEAMRWANWLLASDKLNGAAYAQANLPEAERVAGFIGVHDIEKESMISARLVLAHGNFALEEYRIAQAGYETLLSILPAGDERIKELTNRLAATFFQQSEQLLALAKVKETLEAPLPEGQDIAVLSETQKLALKDSIALLRRIMQQTPNSTFRAAAQYDTATYLLALESWTDALPLLLDFQTRFPKNDLVSTIPGKLLVAYEKSEQWEPAASMLIAQHKAEPDSQLGRESLFVAAEYYLKAGNRAQALDSFRSYAHRYPSPLSDANEARFKMTEFYQESGEDAKRRFWLNKLIDADRAAKDERSPRSRYLAAMASMVFANDADIAYKKIKLTLPLNKSLQRKQTALNTAIARYDGVMAYGVAEYTTQANYALANLYAVLATDLMDSARPEGLSPLELSQYELLLEEQAFPFEETSITLHENNAKRAHNGLYDDWVKESLKTLEGMLPVRYRKPEQIEELSVADFE